MLLENIFFEFNNLKSIPVTIAYFFLFVENNKMSTYDYPCYNDIKNGGGGGWVKDSKLNSSSNFYLYFFNVKIKIIRKYMYIYFRIIFISLVTFEKCSK